MLLLLDTPAFAYSFFGAQKVGAVPIADPDEHTAEEP